MTCCDTQRHRVSDCNRMTPSDPPMLVDEALCLLLHRACPVADIEIVDTYRALGRVLASDQVSTTDAPRFDNSAMDGYALRSQDTVEHETTHLHVTQSICAGRTGQSYDEAMDRYGSDKPDLRFDLPMTDVSELAGETEFRVFTSTIGSGGIVKGFVIPGCGSYAQSEMRQLEDTAKDTGAAGLAHVRLRGSGDLTSLMDEDVVLSSGLRVPLEWSIRLATQMGAKPGDAILLMAGKPKEVNQWLSAMRNHMGESLGMADENLLAFAFVTGFPLFEFGRCTSMVMRTNRQINWRILVSQRPSSVVRSAANRRRT